MNRKHVIILVFLVVSIFFAIVQTLIIIGEKKLPMNEVHAAKLDISGGIAGMQIEVEYYRNGSIIYKNFKTGFMKQVQAPDEIQTEFFEYLKKLMKKYPEGFKLEPKPGSADFFVYKLDVTSGYKKVVYEWTDTSYLIPELHMLSQSIFNINDMIVRQVEQQISLKILVEKYDYQVGEIVVFKVVSKNIGSSDFRYGSPTPCHPNFKVIVYSPDGKELEVYPKGVPMDRPCIQVIEERTLNVGEEISSEYEYVCSFKGKYIIRAWFPYAEWSEKRWENEVVIEVK